MARRSPARDLYARRRRACGHGPRSARREPRERQRPRRRRRRPLPRGVRSRRRGRAARRQRAAPAPRKPPRPAGHQLWPGRRDRADLRPCTGRRPRAAMSAQMTIELRKLKLRDLGAIEEIERASYPTPWSRSMFAGELAKPSSIGLGAFDEAGRLLGYLVVSRYVDAWHIMNLAVHPGRRREGIASRLLDELFDRTTGDQRR